MKAAVSAEWVGKNEDDLLSRMGGKPIRKPWCAELQLSRRGFHRAFLKGKIDYANANNKESRGVFIWYTLSCGKVYEIKRQTSWRSSERVFISVNPQGQIHEGSQEDAEKWLSDPLV